MICKALRDYGIDAPIDVHLMVSPVDRSLTILEAGASVITFHPEAGDLMATTNKKDDVNVV